MPGVMCRSGETAPGETRVVLERDETLVIIRGVPADVCTQCGEAYFSEEVASRLEHLANDAISRGVEVEILRSAA